MISMGEKLESSAFHLCYIYHLSDGMSITGGSSACLNQDINFNLQM